MLWRFPARGGRARRRGGEARSRDDSEFTNARPTEDGIEPQWFAHQYEINRLVLSRHSLQANEWYGAGLDCPFPDG